MAKTKSYKARIGLKGQPKVDATGRFATKEEGDSLAAMLQDLCGDAFETDCVECNDAVNAEMTPAGPKLKTRTAGSEAEG